ncbi:MAG: hypothetical protein LH614_11400 [Pyrinomonadaceae bacterium]|nr:hypothetical protein [Pyrinomonadaceae bacterium]
MKNFDRKLDAKVLLLKTARLKILALHKALIDDERNSFERLNGQITGGQFLNLLVDDKNFQWLRTFSILIVEIDEMLDLDDGFTENMIDDYLLQMRQVVSFELADEDFKSRYKNFIQNNPDIALRNKEIKDLLDDRIA